MSSSWLRGVLPFVVASVLAEQPRHGHAVLQRITGLNLGTLHPVLHQRWQAFSTALDNLIEHVEGRRK